jgi:hypothetical protein
MYKQYPPRCAGATLAVIAQLIAVVEQRGRRGIMSQMQLNASWVRALISEKLLGRPSRQIFAQIYRHNSWGNGVSVSGDGSDLTQTKAIREALPALVRAYGVTTILDAPCGDYYWMNTVDLKVQRYIGADIVPELIQANQSRYGSTNVSFVTRDITSEDLPQVDLILCRDCLVHLKLEHAIGAIENFRRSKSRYLLTTTYPGLLQRNADLFITGDWRPLDLQLPPFSLPPPDQLLIEGCTEVSDYKEKSLGLWRLT